MGVDAATQEAIIDGRRVIAAVARKGRDILRHTMAILDDAGNLVREVPFASVLRDPDG
ncbi:hypothetical protein WGT02_25020 (plasmid) [Rhizobium sp. T1470]|uniref:hypothetical protein n=1 Tax=unclassified Rhizobium TaxID=2613769 RepID=UPI001AAEF1B4|nr:hypothetical protein [Rhizobium sp. T1473]MCA0805762.1 hypothetical protein [Rhizobium sp. T1473]